MRQESQIQSAFVMWCQLNERGYPALKLAFSVPNGAWAKNYAMAAKLKREGMRAGIPDWILPARGKILIDPYLSDQWQWSPGLAIEFKRLGAKVTKGQANYHALLRQQGWRVEVCNDWYSARQIVEEYLA